MSTAETAPPNRPYWVAHLSPNAERAREFYGAVFGWTFDDIAGPDAPPFFIASVNGQRVASITGPQDPATWIAAVAIANLDRTRHDAVSAGGTAPGESVDITTLGRFHRLHDPAGAEIHIVQPSHNGGLDQDIAPSAEPSITLSNADISAVASFYETLFGWHLDASGPTTVVPRPGRVAVRSERAIPDQTDAKVDQHGSGADWAPVFWVEDRGRCTATALASGAQLLNEAAGPPASTATLADPDGARFHISQELP